MKSQSKILLRFKYCVALSLIAIGAGIPNTFGQLQDQADQAPASQQAVQPPAAQSSNAAPAHINGQTIVDGELLVQFKDTATDADVNDAMAKAKLHVKKHIQSKAKKDKGQRGVTLAATDLAVEDAIAELKKHPAVEFAEPNWVYTHQTTSNDPYYSAGYLWGMYGDLTSPSTVWGSQAAEAWNAGYVGTNTVYVGVIDEGIQFTHPELGANIWNNPFDPPDGIDNDGNGYVDDAHGWNFYNSDNTIFDATGDHHGTHVAGTIGAKGGNGLGVAGVNWNVTIISGKFLGAQGGTSADAIEAIDYFVDLKTRHNLNLVALNNSWGGGGYSQALHDSIIRAAKANILFIAAAGNGDSLGNGLNNDSTPNYPSNYDTRQGTSTESAAAYDAVIAVAAIDNTGARATFSNYGARTVHLGAPGVSILSTLPSNSYGYASGTSMATPHVTGAVALYASTHPDATADQIRNAILASVQPTPSLSGITVTGGRLDLSTVIGAPQQPPPQPAVPAPTGVSASAGKAQVNGNIVVSVSWSSSSGATSYKVKRATSASGPFTIVASGVTTMTYNDTVAANGSAYYYVVSAVSERPISESNTASTVTPLGPAPSNLIATALSSSQIRLAWTDQSSDETGFRVDYWNGAAWAYLGSVSSTSGTVSGLAANRTYYFRVRAYNATASTAYSNTASAKTYY